MVARPALVEAVLLNRATAAPGKSFGKAKNCIILYLSGGPAQLDTFDPKPDSPEDIRGEFKTIQTSLPGVRFSELLPNAAKWMHKSALVRTSSKAGLSPRSMNPMTWVGTTRKRFFHQRLPHIPP